MAREATQGLIDKAKEWKSTAAETFYGKSGAGLSFFGISEDDFKNDNTAKSAREWLTGLIDVRTCVCAPPCLWAGAPGTS